MAFSFALTWGVVLAVCWLGWQLLRQNGRLLLRLEELEKRLNELEFGEGDEPEGLPVGTDTPTFELPDLAGERKTLTNGSHHLQPLSGPMEEGGQRPGEGDRAARFGNRSLANSRLKRNGLKSGTSAPDFRLPRLDGHGEMTLSELLGKRVLLVFSSPHCGPCDTLAPELEKFHREHPEVEVVMISKGEPKENRAKVKEHGLTFPILLQQQWEISRLYAMFATPIAYFIEESGILATDVAVGTEAILELMARAERLRHETLEVV